MERTSLLEKLELVAPALASADLIPVMSHFCFTGTRVFAYNDQIGISVPCKTDFKGALPGSTLLGLLKQSRAKEIEFEMDDTVLTVKAASSRIKLGYLTTDAFVFEMPEPNDNAVMPVDVADFMIAIDACMRSVSHDTSVADQLGVTLTPEDKVMNLYSTNDATLTHARVKMSAPYKLKHAILSASFCQQLMKLSAGVKSLKLEIFDGQSMLVSGSTLLFGRLVDSDNPLDFKGVIEHRFPKVNHKKLAPIPSKMKLIIERALVIAESKADTTKTVITVKDGIAKFYSKSDRGEVRDGMQVGEEQGAVIVKVEPRLVKNGLNFFDHFLLTESCVIMAKGDIVYLIAATNG